MGKPFYDRIMVSFGWFDFLRRNDAPRADLVQGLVLSGGGSRVSFQLGALAYLYGHEVIAPTRIVGTSGGSIIAITLAQFAEAPEQARALAELDEVWMAMTSPDEMFAEQAWFTQLRQEAATLMPLLGAAEPTPESARRSEEHEQERRDAEERIRDALENDPSRDVSWSLARSWQLMGALPAIGRSGPKLAASVRGARLAQSMFRPGPIVTRLLYEGSFREERVRTSGVQLRIAMVGLDSGELRFMREDGRLVDRDNVPLPGDDASYDLPLGIWASCAIPGVFKPVAVGDEVYVDGGVRENVPVEMAVTHLGVTHPYVIAAAPPGVTPGRYADKDIIGTVLRATAITSDEAMVDEVAWARAAGAIVINPEVDVHDAMTVEPTLMRINHDYGYLRAAEEVLGADADARRTVREMVTVRLALHHLLQGEDSAEPRAVAERMGALVGAEPAPDAAVRAAGENERRFRDRLAALVAACDPALLPPGANAWADEG